MDIVLSCPSGCGTSIHYIETVKVRDALCWKNGDPRHIPDRPWEISANWIPVYTESRNP
jgi:hypothetical protein